MTFLLPIGLIALLLLPLVALLHLIQQRRERLRVPSLQIWRDLQRQTVQHKPRRLPLTLLLLLHLLLTLLLALALGQPLLEAARGQALHTAIVIDTSTSMAATDEQPTRFAAAQAAARKIIGGLRRGDSAALIELSAQPGILAQAEGRDTVLAGRTLDSLRPGGSDGELTSALSLAQATARPNADLRIVVLSDQAFRSAATATVAGKIDWLTFGDEGDNAAIVAFAARPLRNGRQQLYARVANLGTRPIARTLRLELDGRRAATEPMRLAPGAEAEWSWPLPDNIQRASADLTGDDLQPLDDRAAVVLGSDIQTRVELVTAETTTLERALRAQRGLSVTRVDPANFRTETDADLVVFYKFVPETLPAAPALLVAPSSNQSIIKVQDMVEVEPDNSARDERFAAIDLKPVTFDRVARVETPAWASVAMGGSAAAGGGQVEVPLVLTGQFNDQPIAIWTFDPAASTLPNRLAFPLLTAATTSALLPQPNDRLPLGAPAPFALRTVDGQAYAAGARLTQPGIYQAQSGNGALAVNALDATEADLRAQPQPQITTVARPVAAADTPTGTELWQPLVIAGLIVLVIEWLYSNRQSFRRKQRVQA